MKTIFSLLLSLLQPGLYKCMNGNNSSICEQILQVHDQQSISITYAGDCGGQGPYSYLCEDNFCSDDSGTITFEIKDETHYRWENKQYNFFCEFEKVN